MRRNAQSTVVTISILVIAWASYLLGQGSRSDTHQPLLPVVTTPAVPAVATPLAENLNTPVTAEKPAPVPSKRAHLPLPTYQRTWTDSSGKHTVKASIVEIRGETIYLRKEDGAFSVVPLSRLCEADRTFAHSLQTDKIIEGKVVGITDGDTLTVRGGDETVKIRLEGIDCPESSQAFGSKAKIVLSDKVFGKDVRIEWWEKDKYGRTLGHIICDGKWINKELVDEGMAWHYKQYNKSAILADAEVKAREARVGLWQDKDPMSPWAFRATPGQPRAPPVALVAQTQSLIDTDVARHIHDDVDSTETTVYITATGEKYHAAGCRFLSKSSIPISLAEAVGRYAPCSVCHPPVAASNKTVDTEPAVSPSTESVSRSPRSPLVTDVDRNPSGQTATGNPTHIGPRGGVYHYSPSGKKVYQKKK